MTAEAPPGNAMIGDVVPATPRLRSFSWQRNALALAVAAMGIVDLLSALLSHPPERLLALRHLVPTEVLDTSRTFTLLAGSLLLVTAWGLRRGKRRAFVAALLLCAVSVPVNLLKAFDVEEATVAAALMFVLGVSADAFRVKSRELDAAGWWRRTVWSAAALLAYAVVGMWVLRRLYGIEPSVGRAFEEAANGLFGIGHPTTIVPSGMHGAAARITAWYLRSLPLLSLAWMLGVTLTALRPAAHRSRVRAERALVDDLVRAHGVASVSAFALEDDADYVFSPNRRAVIAYRFESDTLLTIGDPLGPPEEVDPLLRDFAEHCQASDWAFAFFQARPEALPVYQALGWRALHVGVEPVIHPPSFTLEGGAIGDVRRMSRKAVEAGLEVRLYGSGEGAEPAGATIEELRQVSHQWLRGRAGGEKGFCMGRFDPSRWRDARIAVAWNPERRRAEGFLTWVPLPARRGWALDLMRRRNDAPNGTMELLVVRSIEAARERGDQSLSLALSALAPGAPRAGESLAGAPPEVDRARSFLVEHLARYYDFKGLFEWKRKFQPALEDRFLVVPRMRMLPQVALALARAQSPGGLLSYGRGLARRAS